MMGRMKRWIVIVAGWGALAAAAWGGDGFAWRLWRAAAGTEGNAVVSPFSVAEAMGMVLAGARGDTAAEIARAVLPEGVEDGPGYFARVNGDLAAAAGEGNLRIGNALWLRRGEGVSEGYGRVVEEAFGGVAEEVEWGEEGAARANRWVSEATGGMIAELFGADAFGDGTGMVLANATCFRGRWASAFEREETAEEAFRLRDGREGLTPTMHRKGKAWTGEWKDGAMVRLPYEGGDLEMRVVVPKEGTGLDKLEGRLAEEWDEWTACTERRETEVWLPRFSVRWGAESLKEPLERLGVEKAFGAGADFGGMGPGGWQLGDVVHAAVIDVDEEGTRAAAATGAMMAKAFRPVKSVEFRADRPFLFAVVENVSGTVLFCGRVERPDGWKAAAEEPEDGENGGDDVDNNGVEASGEESDGASAQKESEEEG